MHFVFFARHILRRSTWLTYHVAAEEGAHYKKSFRVVEHTKGAERRTPNKYDFILYLSNPGTILADTSKPPVAKINVPHVPNAFLLTNVLSRRYGYRKWGRVGGWR